MTIHIINGPNLNLVGLLTSMVTALIMRRRLSSTTD